MTTPIPLMVELCAGTAALSLRLHRDAAKPPVSRMGAKTGYANVILRILGLAPGQRAAAYLWCEPDPGVRLLLHAYRDAALARAAASIIRGWAAEDPRELWERLRAEGPPRLPEGGADPREVARAVITGQWAYRRMEPASGWCSVRVPRAEEPIIDGDRKPARNIAIDVDALGAVPEAAIHPDARTIDPYEVARFAQIVASNRLINTAWSDAEGRWINTGDGGATFGGAEFATPPERTAEGIDGAPSDLPAVVAPDAREVDPREVARWAHMQGVSINGKGSVAGFGGWERPFKVHGEVVNMLRQDGHPEVLAPRLNCLPAFPALIHPDARTIDPPALPPGTVCYMDPPYVATTGYAHDLGRAEVVALARRWAAAGATVAISEAEPIPELVAEGWHAVRIDGERVGQKRTFSKQQAEWLTLNRAPAWVPPVQGSLFGGGR